MPDIVKCMVIDVRVVEHGFKFGGNTKHFWQGSHAPLYDAYMQSGR